MYVLSMYVLTQQSKAPPSAPSQPSAITVY